MTPHPPRVDPIGEALAILRDMSKPDDDAIYGALAALTAFRREWVAVRRETLADIEALAARSDVSIEAFDKLCDLLDSLNPPPPDPVPQACPFEEDSPVIHAVRRGIGGGVHCETCGLRAPTVAAWNALRKEQP